MSYKKFKIKKVTDTEYWYFDEDGEEFGPFLSYSLALETASSAKHWKERDHKLSRKLKNKFDMFS